jgi:hypothetical protein
MKSEKLDGGRRIDDFGVIMPWYTQPCLQWLETQELSGKMIFEYGGGDSTSWYRSRGCTVYGVDSNEQWITDGFECFTEKKDYVMAIQKYGEFDIIINDGLWRDSCTSYALDHLKKGGLLIIDNYHQPSVEPSWPKTDELIKHLKKTIYKEPAHADWKTAVIIK